MIRKPRWFSASSLRTLISLLELCVREAIFNVELDNLRITGGASPRLPRFNVSIACVVHGSLRLLQLQVIERVGAGRALEE